jgi:hypothetical protein
MRLKGSQLLVYVLVYVIVANHTKAKKASSADPITCSRSALTLDHSKAQQERSNKQEVQAKNILQNISQGLQHRPTQGRHKLGYKVVVGYTQPGAEMGPARPATTPFNSVQARLDTAQDILGLA